ncbi:N-acylneuraminate cytidylyltransferase [Nymphon striatum]|nr:N-acylneuraminate cytidylyltransferase [Nymphon striatum]
MSSHIAAVILARGGSKTIPLKNIRKLCGVPMIEWNIHAIIDFGKFNSIWVSTDHPDIAKIALSFGVQVHWRSQETCTDDCPSITALSEFLSHHEEIDIAALIQCTTPFLHPIFLERAFTLIFEKNYESVFTVTRKKQFRWKEVTQGESTVALNFNPKNRPRRQDWDGELIENGLFYFAKRYILMLNLFQGGRCGYIEMPEQCSVDIDNEWDCLIAETLLPKFGYHRLKCHCNNCANLSI